MKQQDILKNFFGKGQAETLDKEHKTCIYCGKNIYTTNKGICSRKNCVRQQKAIPKWDKHGRYILSKIPKYENRIIKYTEIDGGQDG